MFLAFQRTAILQGVETIGKETNLEPVETMPRKLQALLRYVDIISDYRHGMLRGSQPLCGFKAQAARRAVVSVIEARGTSPLGSIRCDRMRDSKD